MLHGPINKLLLISNEHLDIKTFNSDITIVNNVLSLSLNK